MGVLEIGIVKQTQGQVIVESLGGVLHMSQLVLSSNPRSNIAQSELISSQSFKKEFR